MNSAYIYIYIYYIYIFKAPILKKARYITNINSFGKSTSPDLNTKGVEVNGGFSKRLQTVKKVTINEVDKPERYDDQQLHIKNNPSWWSLLKTDADPIVGLNLHASQVKEEINEYGGQTNMRKVVFKKMTEPKTLLKFSGNISLNSLNLKAGREQNQDIDVVDLS